MSRAAGARAKRRRLQPYAWLGAGAVTVGLGAAMIGGAAVAFAESGTDAGRATTQSEAAATPATASTPDESTTVPTRKKSAARSGRAPATTSDPAAPAEVDPAAPAEVTTRTRSSVAGVAGSGDTEIPTALAAAAVATPDSTAETPAVVTRQSAGRGARSVTGTATGITQPPTEPATGAGVPAAEANPESPIAPAAVVPAPAANPAPNMQSWLPVTPIVPGAHVQLALQEIAAAQGVIQAQTWGTGNFIAGLAAIAPQILLAGAALSLNAWQFTNPGAQQLLAAVSGIPVVAQVAQLNLIGSMLWTTASDVSLGAAEFLLPVVGVFGAPTAVVLGQPLINAAREDGTVYAVVPLSVKLGTQPVANVSINGGTRSPLLVDTGASGIVVLPSVVPNVEQLTNVGSGVSCFSGGLCYHYETYQSPVDFGGGAVTDTGLVNVVTDDEEYPDSVATFKEYFSWGADGIVGVGANTAGPGPAPIANATLPGELSNGVLLFQNLLPFGLFGVMVFGPNPLPTRVSLPGAPDAYVKVSVNGAAQTNAGAIIDSGGVFGTLPVANAPAGSVPGDDLPAGTRISVYAPDGTTLLYTYITQGGLSATPVIDSGLMNTGNAPYQQNPIYLNYAAPDGIGSTDFSIW